MGPTYQTTMRKEGLLAMGQMHTEFFSFPRSSYKKKRHIHFEAGFLSRFPRLGSGVHFRQAKEVSLVSLVTNRRHWFRWVLCPRETHLFFFKRTPMPWSPSATLAYPATTPLHGPPAFLSRESRPPLSCSGRDPIAWRELSWNPT